MKELTAHQWVKEQYPHLTDNEIKVAVAIGNEDLFNSTGVYDNYLFYNAVHNHLHKKRLWKQD